MERAVCSMLVQPNPSAFGDATSGDQYPRLSLCFAQLRGGSFDSLRAVLALCIALLPRCSWVSVRAIARLEFEWAFAHSTSYRAR